MSMFPCLRSRSPLVQLGVRRNTPHHHLRVGGIVFSLGANLRWGGDDSKQNFDCNLGVNSSIRTAQGQETQFPTLARCLSPHSMPGRPRLDRTPLGQADEGTCPYANKPKATALVSAVDAPLLPEGIIRGMRGGANGT